MAVNTVTPSQLYTCQAHERVVHYHMITWSHIVYCTIEWLYSDGKPYVGLLADSTWCVCVYARACVCTYPRAWVDAAAAAEHWYWCCLPQLLYYTMMASIRRDDRTLLLEIKHHNHLTKDRQEDDKQHDGIATLVLQRTLQNPTTGAMWAHDSGWFYAMWRQQRNFVDRHGGWLVWLSLICKQTSRRVLGCHDDRHTDVLRLWKEREWAPINKLLIVATYDARQPDCYGHEHIHID